MTHVLKSAGDDLSRDNVRRLASNLKDVQLPMLLPGVLVANSAKDLHAYASMQPVRFNGVEMEATGPVLAMK